MVLVSLILAVIDTMFQNTPCACLFEFNESHLILLALCNLAKAQRNRNALSTQHVETPHTVLRDYFLPDARFGIPVMGLTMVATVTSGSVRDDKHNSSF